MGPRATLTELMFCVSVEYWVFMVWVSASVAVVISCCLLELLKTQGYEKASLAVQKANYAVRMYEKVGFEVVDENDEELIMVCNL